MSFNGSGVFNRLYSWVADKAANVKITASRVDAEMDGFATGLSNILCRDGQSTPTANISMGGFKITNLGLATASTDALSKGAADQYYSRTAVPGGRITLATGTPVMSSDVTSSATVYYTPYINNSISHYDGSSFSATTFAEMSLAPTIAASTNYDVFSYLVASVPTLKLAAWTNDSTRATGLTRTSGVWLNTDAISSGPGALRGTYLGTIRSNGSSLFSWILGGAAEGGTAAFLGVWNLYNRVKVAAVVQDSAEFWASNTSVWGKLDDSTGNRVTLVQGLSEDVVKAQLTCGLNSNTGNDIYIGIGVARLTDLDAVINVPDGVIARGSSETDTTSHTAYYAGYPGIGTSIVQAIQSGGDADSFVIYVGATDSGQMESLVVEVVA